MMRDTPNVLSPEHLTPHLMGGGVAVIPTDTVVGLAVAPVWASRIWRLKRRPADKPLILMGASTDALLDQVSVDCHDDAQRLAEKFWPGALTLVLPAQGQVQDALNPGGSSLGVRIPDCELTQLLLDRTGPLATSSANPSGEPAAMTAMAASSYFPDLPLLGPQPWPKVSGQASTVIAWRGPGQWQLLRRGAVIPLELETPD